MFNQIEPPSQPGRPAIGKVTHDSATVHWEPSKNSVVSGYFVEVKSRNSIVWERQNKNSILKVNYKIKGQFCIIKHNKNNFFFEFSTTLI